jgi:hypothetical protein
MIQTQLSREPTADGPTPENHLAGDSVPREGASFLHRSHLFGEGIAFVD